MPCRTDISSILIIGAAVAPSPRRGEGWGEGALTRRVITGAAPPHPALSPTGRGFRKRAGLFGAVAGQEEFLPDRLKDSIGVREHIVVPEAQHPIAVFVDDGGSRRILGGLVLSAVELDRQPGGAAGEVGDEIVDLELADELLAFKPAAAEVMPETRLSVGLVRSQLARDRRQALPAQLSTPSPNPLPLGERGYAGSCHTTPSPRRGEGWGEGARRPKPSSASGQLHPLEIEPTFHA